MRFNGSPELVNGRLAMVALLVAAHNEVATGETVMQQFASAPLLSYLAFGVLVYASLVPMMKGARHEAFGERALWRKWGQGGRRGGPDPTGLPQCRTFPALLDLPTLSLAPSPECDARRLLHAAGRVRQRTGSHAGLCGADGAGAPRGRALLLAARGAGGPRSDPVPAASSAGSQAALCL